MKQKPDPPSSKKLCIITVTRIFLLTHDHQSLVREITTPSLPGFITACLNLTKSPSSPSTVPEKYVEDSILTALHAFCDLIAMHPTSFRPFVPQIQSMVYPLIAPTPSNSRLVNDPVSTSVSVSERARHLFVLLHVCGPKNTAGEEWSRSLDALITSVQGTADKVFRSLIEDMPSSARNHLATNSNLVDDVVNDQAPTPLALPAWTGINAGIERLEGLLHTLQTFLATATTAAITLPVGDILSLVDRLLSVFPPGNGRNPRVRPEIDRDEREGLWVGLPRLQISVIGVCSLMISRMGHGSAAIAYTMMEQLLWTFESQYENDCFRKATYTLLSQILSAYGPSLPRTYVNSLSQCIRMCCEDLLPSVEAQFRGAQASGLDTKTSQKGNDSSINADSYLKTAIYRIDLSTNTSHIRQAARELLPIALTCMPNEYLPFSLRCQMDRTAIITQNKHAMLASVMNPIPKRKGQKQTSSILPQLASAHPDALEVETLLRPQMPLVQSRQRDWGDTGSDREDDAYMHDNAQDGESNVSHHDPEGINGNTNVERNFTMENSIMPLEATSGAVEGSLSSAESTSVFTSTETGLPEHRSAFSHNPTKRARVDDSVADKQEFTEPDSTEQIEVESTRKRSRVIPDETQQQDPLELVPGKAATIDSAGTGPAVTDQAVKNVSVSASAVMPDRGSILEQQGSDESDFEMPILNLDPDTEDDEEEEEEDNDD